MIKYARGPVLDHGGVMETERLPAARAITTINSVYAAYICHDHSGENAGCSTGVMEKIFLVQRKCWKSRREGFWHYTRNAFIAGDVGNGFLPGQLNVLVDPIPYSRLQTQPKVPGGQKKKRTIPTGNGFGVRRKVFCGWSVRCIRALG
ncbi:hypothetical protein P7H22_26655 [Paenibacillus larvae]|nr:hypothetical protein [Paenibacillus larvae]MDT2243186.1 hypothetical protein [Paenibacillus larvae]